MQGRRERRAHAIALSRSPKAEAESVILRDMAVKRANAATSWRPTIAIVGAGHLADVLAVALHEARYTIDSVITRAGRASMIRARALAKRVGSRAALFGAAPVSADIVWLCVPDSAISGVAKSLAKSGDWKGKIVLHSSGALTSDELDPMRQQGAAVASIHPLMTFVKGSTPSLTGVAFAIEGDAAAERMVRRIVKDLGGEVFSISKEDKPAYHAWGMFASPLLTALLATTERVAAAAGVPAMAAKRRMLPILTQTIANYVAVGAAGAFSGPIVRGDVEVVARHLRALRTVPEARDVYMALARAALHYLPANRRDAMKRILTKATTTK
jgi:predicted short-subunit dehydrogenase-like oxidoreductase (DUF2520 family)